MGNILYYSYVHILICINCNNLYNINYTENHLKHNFFLSFSATSTEEYYNSHRWLLFRDCVRKQKQTPFRHASKRRRFSRALNFSLILSQFSGELKFVKEKFPIYAVNCQRFFLLIFVTQLVRTYSWYIIKNMSRSPLLPNFFSAALYSGAIRQRRANSSAHRAVPVSHHHTSLLLRFRGGGRERKTFTPLQLGFKNEKYIETCQRKTERGRSKSSYTCLI